MNSEFDLQILGENAMWVGDYEQALRIFLKYKEEREKKYNIKTYRSYYNCLICSLFLNLDYEEYKYYLDEVHRRYYNMRKIIEDKMNDYYNMLEEDVDVSELISKFKRTFDEEDSFFYLLSPRLVKTNINRMIKYRKKLQKPEIYSNGLFIYTITNDINSLLIKSYSLNLLNIKKLKENTNFNIQKELENIYYITDDELNIISSINSDGKIMARYMLQNLYDESGPKKISIFFNKLNDTFKDEYARRIRLDII